MEEEEKAFLESIENDSNKNQDTEEMINTETLLEVDESDDYLIKNESIKTQSLNLTDTHSKPCTSKDILPDDLLIKIAPGQKHKPIGLFYDEDSEELSFPCIYAGEMRKAELTRSFHYSKIAKSETKHHDRRACGVTKLLYNFKKAQIARINEAIQICIKKTPGSYKAKDLTNKNYVEQLKVNKSCYEFLECERLSPPFWEKKKHEVLAMVRQLGVPTFFITITAAETQWPDLLRALEKLSSGKDITEEEAINLSKARKRELVGADPVTCARYFEYKLNEFMKLMNSDSQEGKKLLHLF